MLEGAKEIATLRKPRVHQQVVEALSLQVLSGDYAPGSALPPEQDLCAWLGVSRSALREAVKVLSTKGLVTTRPRVGTVVRPTDEWRMLDPDLLTLAMQTRPDAEIVLNLIEARQVIEPAAAGLAAARATTVDLESMQAALERMQKCRDRLDFDGFTAADRKFHQALLVASHNLVFRHLSGVIGAALDYAFRITIKPSRGASLPQHVDVFNYVAARDAGGAHRAMLHLLDTARVDLGLSLHGLRRPEVDDAE